MFDLQSEHSIIYINNIPKVSLCLPGRVPGHVLVLYTTNTLHSAAATLGNDLHLIRNMISRQLEA